MSGSAKASWGILGPGLLLVVVFLAFLTRGLFLNPNEIRTPLLSQPSPAFELPSLEDGSPVRHTDLLGKPSVVNFWATWCASCPQEHPLLVDLAARYQGRVQFVGIAYNDKNEALSGWLQRHGGATYPTLIDINGKAAIAYGVYGVPETYVLDAQGIIRYKHTGMINPAEVARQLEELL